MPCLPCKMEHGDVSGKCWDGYIKNLWMGRLSATSARAGSQKLRLVSGKCWDGYIKNLWMGRLSATSAGAGSQKLGVFSGRCWEDWRSGKPVMTIWWDLL